MTKREQIEPHTGDKRYVRRDDKGRFTADQAEVGRSLSQDVRKHAKRGATKGEGNKGDES
jgi:hypothetical protein